MNIQELTKLFDLEYFDGPLLSLFADANGDFFLYKWYDLSENSHQWLVFRVNFTTIQNYLNGTVSEYALLNDEPSQLFHVIVFSEKGKPKILNTISTKDIITEYDGLRSVFFQPEMCPNWKAVQYFFKKEAVGKKEMRRLGASPETPTEITAKFEIAQGSDKLYYIHLVDHEGRILMKSEAFKQVSLAKKEVRHLLVVQPKHKEPAKAGRKRELQVR